MNLPEGQVGGPACAKPDVFTSSMGPCWIKNSNFSFSYLKSEQTATCILLGMLSPYQITSAANHTATNVERLQYQNVEEKKNIPTKAYMTVKPKRLNLLY